MSAGLILTYLAILGILFVLGKSFWKPLFILFKVLFQGALGAAVIYGFNLLGALWQIAIPLNPFNALFTGLLGLPGLISLLVLRYWIKV